MRGDEPQMWKITVKIIDRGNGGEMRIGCIPGIIPREEYRQSLWEWLLLSLQFAVFPVRDNDTNTARDYLCFLNCTLSLMCVHVRVCLCAPAFIYVTFCALSSWPLTFESSIWVSTVTVWCIGYCVGMWCLSISTFLYIFIHLIFLILHHISVIGVALIPLQKLIHRRLFLNFQATYQLFHGVRFSESRVHCFSFILLIFQK